MITIPEIPIDSLVEGRNLVLRLRKSAPFHEYVLDRLHLVLPAAAIWAMLITATTAATVAAFASHSALILPAFILAPFFFSGACAVGAYLFLCWLENRALRHSLRHAVPLPRMPWLLALIFLIAPAVVLLLSWWKVALPLLALTGATPFVFARLDRNPPGRGR